jgi:hypothetical protein
LDELGVNFDHIDASYTKSNALILIYSLFNCDLLDMKNKRETMHVVFKRIEGMI